MNFFNRAFDKYIQAREAQAERFVNEYMADRGIDGLDGLNIDSRD
ncbi:hypothetical protein SAMN04515647_4678 [Cohaesibacter sp. ES.047]|nr:hypothetical protein [Cohaesibacter sp. ES.047]SNY94358.1 hypothetical protein SAMN04515647_4678 [Cohaesibacter sp. ES.047]